MKNLLWTSLPSNSFRLVENGTFGLVILSTLILILHKIFKTVSAAKMPFESLERIRIKHVFSRDAFGASPNPCPQNIYHAALNVFQKFQQPNPSSSFLIWALYNSILESFWKTSLNVIFSVTFLFWQMFIQLPLYK